MADRTPPRPTRDELVQELKALHERREREPLSEADEIRYADLWTWWQAGGSELGDALRSELGEAESSGEDPGATPPAETVHEDGDVPAEWLAALEDDGAELLHADAADDAAGAGAEPDLVGEWEAWQANQPRGDPFALMPDEDDPAAAASYEEVMSARAEIFGSGAEVGLLGEADPGEPGAADDPASPPGGDERGDRASDGLEGGEPPALQGARRVVIHLADGQVRRGQVSEVQLARDEFGYVAAGGARESVPRWEVRTAFFMRAPGAAEPAPDGDRIHVALRDGREITGRSPDHASASDGFTLVPDGRSTAALVWIARAAVRGISPLD